MFQQLPLDDTLPQWWNSGSGLKIGDYCITWPGSSLKHLDGVGIQVEAGITTVTRSIIWA